MTADVLSSPALPLLLKLEAEGFEVQAAGDRLRLRPHDRVTPELLAELRAQKADLLMLVRICDEGVQDRRELFAQQLAATPASVQVPVFLFRPGVPYEPGICFSCGDALPAPHFGRCWRCALAWRLVCRVLIPADLALHYDEARVLT